MSNQPTVLITARNFDEAAASLLTAAGCTLRRPEGTSDPAPDELPALLDGVAAWVIGSTKVDRALLASHPGLLLLARRGVGYEAIDTAAAAALGRVVTIAAGGNGPSVADHALALMLALSKQLVPLTEGMRGGDWTFAPAAELHEKTVGIIGLGRVGRLVARRLRGFDVRVLALDVAPDPAYAAEHGITMTDLPTLLRDSDIVTLHAPLTALTANLVDAAALAAMKPGAILINTARGGMVDEVALLAALEAGHIAGAGLDVFLAEKDPADRATATALARHKRVIATPHSAAATREGLARSNRITVQCVLAVLNGEAPPRDCVVVDGRVGA